jgi:hypothetical protein
MPRFHLPRIRTLATVVASIALSGSSHPISAADAASGGGTPNASAGHSTSLSRQLEAVDVAKVLASPGQGIS